MPDTINVNKGFFTHPKTVRLVTLAGLGADARLIQLWTYIAEYRPETGGFEEWTPDEVETAANWKGERGIFVNVLIGCKFMHQVGNGFFMHDWAEHQPHLVKYAKVSSERKRAANERWDKEKRRGKYSSGKGKDSDAKVTLGTRFACPNTQFCNANAVQCNAVQCNIYTPLSPNQISEAAERIADHYGKTAKPKALDKSGSRKVFLETLRKILAKGTLEKCLIASIDNYSASVRLTEKSENDVVYRYGLQTFFGPKNEYWKDFILPPEGAGLRRSSNDAVESIDPALEAWAEGEMAGGRI